MPTVRNENEMATNAADADEQADEGDESSTPAVYNSPSKAPANKQVFFTIYKKGQGKWTRLGTVFAAAGLGILTAYNFFQYVTAYLPVSADPDPVVRIHHDRLVNQLVLAASVVLLALWGLLIFYFGNKPRNADFLIATDSEMKKVNWTTQGELVGSTRVVVLFLFFIAIFLSVVDLVFYEFFHMIRVLQ